MLAYALVMAVCMAVVQTGGMSVGQRQGVGEANGTVDTEKMTQLNHGGVSEPSMPFYYQGGDRVLQEGGKENPPLCEREVVSVDRGTVEDSDRYIRDGHGDSDLSWQGKVLGSLKLISFQQYLCML